jgi:hypothetical protein
VPSIEEWYEMLGYLISNGFNYDGTTSGNKIAKSLATGYMWRSSFFLGSIGRKDFPDKINASCFSALPGGYRNGKWMGISDGFFNDIELEGYWWTSDPYFHIDLNAHLSGYRWNAADGGSLGFSVRCVKD